MIENALTKVVLASGNAGKLMELKNTLRPLAVELLSQKQFDVPEVEETGLSFVENALIKARAAARCSGLPAIADDSGLAVDFLNGAPGVRSARYSGKGDNANNTKLLAALADVPPEQRGARFHCALVYLHCETDPIPLICQASWEGSILTSPRGGNGFGYDPLFFVPEHRCSSAELDPAIKNQISHRAKASAVLLQALRTS
ncbi:MAG: RdgB/HAM1 family non-canonical purine NTP pyrophosphatase [Pseudomonadota bacterium]